MLPPSPTASSRLPWAARIAARLPTQCVLCRGWGTSRVCAACVERFAAVVPRCRRCALRVPAGVHTCGTCLAAPPAFEGAVSAVDYAWPWDGLVRHFKFHAALDLAPALAQRVAAAWLAREEPAPQWLLPVPLAAPRLRERGYNQAWELARRLAPRIGGQAHARVLQRVRDTPHQLALPHDRRAANVRGAFAVDAARAGALRDAHVMLVDDVMTTGATAAEIARVLLQAGARSVTVAVLARTPRPGD